MDIIRRKLAHPDDIIPGRGQSHCFISKRAKIVSDILGLHRLILRTSAKHVT